MAIFLRPSLPRLRYSLLGADSRAVLVQLTPRRLRDLPRLRAGDRHRLRSHRPRRNEDSARRRRASLAVARVERMPGRSREVREKARGPARHFLAGAARGAAKVGTRGGARMGELEEILAGHLVRRRALLPLARDQGLQDARARAAFALPRLHTLLGLRRRASEARRAPVALGREGGRGPRARSCAAIPAARSAVR